MYVCHFLPPPPHNTVSGYMKAGCKRSLPSLLCMQRKLRPPQPLEYGRDQEEMNPRAQCVPYCSFYEHSENPPDLGWPYMLDSCRPNICSANIYLSWTPPPPIQLSVCSEWGEGTKVTARQLSQWLISLKTKGSGSWNPTARSFSSLTSSFGVASGGHHTYLMVSSSRQNWQVQPTCI